MLKKEELDKIKAMQCLCSLEIGITINGVDLCAWDFGEQYDIDPENAEDYGCGDMQFIPFEEVKQEILKKYNITEKEYRKIQEKLDCLSFGSCGWCS